MPVKAVVHAKEDWLAKGIVEEKKGDRKFAKPAPNILTQTFGSSPYLNRRHPTLLASSYATNSRISDQSANQISSNRDETYLIRQKMQKMHFVILLLKPYDWIKIIKKKLSEIG
jgi:hypothetical protein